MIPVTPTKQHTGLVLLALVCVVAVLHFAQAVLVPVALALLLAFLLAPLAERLQRLGVGRPISVALTSLIAFAVLGALVYVVAHQFLGLVEALPSYRENLLAKVQSVSGSSSRDGIKRGVDTVKELTDELQKTSPGTPGAPDITKVQIVEPPPNVAQVVQGLFGPLIGPFSTAAVVIVFVLFMLLQREDLRDRVVRLLGASDMHTTVTALDDAAQRVSRYLLMQTLINSVQGSLVALGLYLIGVPNALLWGAITILLRFVPYLGPVLAAAGPVALAVAFFPGWTEPLLVLGLIVVLELITNNVLEPRLYGSSVGVSAFALIVAAVFWTWLWGIAGLFLATPLTVCVVVMGKYIPQLEFLAVMLGDQPVLEPRERFYQRLLANDADEAQEVLEEAAQGGSLLELCDSIVLPALRMVENDHERGAIDDARRNVILEQIGELVEELSLPEAADADGAVAADAPRMSVLCLPAADRADEIAAQVLARALAPLGFDAEVLGSATLKSEMLERAAESRPDAICISAAPPAAVIHARYVCKKLRDRLPQVPIVVGLWDAQGDLLKATHRLKAVGAGFVVTSAAATLHELGQLRQHLLQGVRSEVEEEVAPLAPATA